MSSTVSISPERALRLAPAVVLIAAALAGVMWGAPWALWVLATGALLAAVVLLWESLLSLGGESELTLEEALSLAAPSAADEQKRALLRALKDLEFELSVGKISQEDHDLLAARYRGEAKLLLVQLDRNLGPHREHARQLFRERLDDDGIDPSELEAEDASEDPAAEGPPDSEPAGEATANDDPSDETADTNDEPTSTPDTEETK